MTRTYDDGFGDTQELLDLLAEEAAETDRLKAELAQHKAQEPAPEPVDLDSITDRDEFYEQITNVSAAHGLPVDASGNVDRNAPMFDMGGKPLSESAKRVLRERDPRYAQAEADADARDYSPGVVI